MNWLFLILAGIFEMLGVLMINKLHRDCNALSLILLVAGFGLSFLFLTMAMGTLPMGIAYAVWTGIGAAGGAILGMIFYGEPRNILRILCIVMVLGSAVGLKWVS
ncbi:DMT family transporter [Paenibacillus sp. FSL K6-1230]|uniref:DMT family transporter n=1 Tax=Paenibacillus sp. FSL K6-1230 TaxID=2921603 RepID=UPI0030FC2230